MLGLLGCFVDLSLCLLLIVVPTPSFSIFLCVLWIRALILLDTLPSGVHADADAGGSSSSQKHNIQDVPVLAFPCQTSSTLHFRSLLRPLLPLW